MFHSPLSSIALLSVGPVSGCQPRGPVSLPPKDAPVVETFSKQKAMCEGQTAWTVEASPQDWLDASVEWAAIDAATVQENVKRLKIETSVDDQTLGETMKDPSRLEPFSINCSGTVIEGSGIKYALFLPPLSRGEHRIVWQVTVETDMSNGWNDYPKGTELTFTATITVN